MSCNRLSTTCDCKLWSFQPEQFLPATQKGLLTLDEYFAAIECKRDKTNQGFGYGHGFMDHINGTPHFMWRSPDGSCLSSSWKVGYTEELMARYEFVPEGERYRWYQLECPLCFRLYVGWYAAQPGILEPPHAVEPRTYVLTDTSFWHSFNDEPRPSDVANLQELTPQFVAEAVRFYRIHQRLKKG